MNRILAGLVIILLGIVFYRYLSAFSFNHMYLSHIDVSRKTESNIKGVLTRSMTLPIQIQIKNRVYRYTYKDLGIILNAGKTTDLIFESNKKPFPQNITSFFQSFSSPRMLLPVLIFTQDYYQFIDASIFDFSKKKDEVLLDQTNKTIIYKENEERYKIDSENFKHQLVLNFGNSSQPLKPDLVRVANEQKYKVEDYNDLLAETLGKPVQVIVKDGTSEEPFFFLAQDLKGMVSLKYNSENEQLQVDIEDSRFTGIASPHIARFARTTDEKIPLLRLKKDLASLIRSRLRGDSSDTLVTHIEEVPNTDGTVAQEYIEVDLSQQRMYLFRNGDVFNSYKISSGLYFPTPVGDFKILNKAENAFSDIYNVWMPYWMAFAYNSESNAYYGIHELPYWIAGTGQRIQRPREFIGSPHTGGCVALDIGASKEVYDFASVNMPVRIFD